MNPTKLVDLDKLMEAIEWVSCDMDSDNAAYVSRADGTIYWESDGVDEELPEDLEDEGLYARVPHKRDLDLGSRLNLRFARKHLTADQEDQVRHIFSSRGAFARFKQYVDRIGKLQAWYDFRDSAEVQAAREWCEDSGLLPATPREDEDD